MSWETKRLRKEIIDILGQLRDDWIVLDPRLTLISLKYSALAVVEADNKVTIDATIPRDKNILFILELSVENQRKGMTTVSKSKIMMTMIWLSDFLPLGSAMEMWDSINYGVRNFQHRKKEPLRTLSRKSRNVEPVPCHTVVPPTSCGTTKKILILPPVLLP